MILLICRPPLVQTSSKNTTLFVWLTLGVTFIAYSRFISLVIWDITNYLGIACFTVSKKDKNGNWYSAQPNAKQLWYAAYTLYEQEPTLLNTLGHCGLIDSFLDNRLHYRQIQLCSFINLFCYAGWAFARALPETEWLRHIYFVWSLISEFLPSSRPSQSASYKVAHFIRRSASLFFPC